MARGAAPGPHAQRRQSALRGAPPAGSGSGCPSHPPRTGAPAPADTHPTQLSPPTLALHEDPSFRPLYWTTATRHHCMSVTSVYVDAQRWHAPSDSTCIQLAASRVRQTLRRVRHARACAGMCARLHAALALRLGREQVLPALPGVLGHRQHAGAHARAEHACNAVPDQRAAAAATQRPVRNCAHSAHNIGRGKEESAALASQQDPANDVPMRASGLKHRRRGRTLGHGIRGHDAPRRCRRCAAYDLRCNLSGPATQRDALVPVMAHT